MSCWSAFARADVPASQGSTVSAATPAEYEPEVSLPLQSPGDAWRESGFRFDLGLAWTRLRALPFVTSDAPGVTELAAELRLRYRINRWWSASFLLSYGYATYLAGLRGGALQWGIGGEAEVHPLGELGVGLRAAATGLYGEINSSVVDQPTWLVGLRVEYLIVTGFLFATGPFVHGDLSGRDVPDAPPKGAGLTLSGSAGWWFTWR